MGHTLAATKSIADIASLRSARELAYADFREHQVVGRLTKRLSKLSDELLISLWNSCDLNSDAALVAVGGFGRGALFPYSDIDILILLPEDKKFFEEVLAPKIENFVAQCWDTGLEIGSSVRTVAECVSEAEQDITVRTSLLESRLICGKKALFKEFESVYEKTLDAKSFFQAKLAEQIQRHYKYQDTPYSLEPNCKESPGGLRDLQIILWVARAAGLGKTWDDLAHKGLATALEVKQIKRNEAVLSLIRARLHMLAKRREDRLVFDLQHAVAQSMGLGVQQDGSLNARAASEALMKRYYWSAKAVTQLNQILLLNIEERLNTTSQPLHPINERFADKAGMLEVTSDDVYVR